MRCSWRERQLDQPRRGIAVAIVSTGSYFAGAIWPPILQAAMATWGWRDSRYLVLPLLGPRTVRDALGIVGDQPLSPIAQIQDSGVASGLQALEIVDVRTQLLPMDNFRRDALDDYLLVRDAWIQRMPQLAQPLRLVLPIYADSRRSRALVGAGLFLYDHLAGRSILPKAQWLSAKELLQRDPQLQSQGLKGGWEFSDGHMDDYQLGLWVAEQARAAGVRIHEHAPVATVNTAGELHLTSGQVRRFDRLVNIAGPWALELLARSSLQAEHRLDLVRGSHIVFAQPCPQAYLLEVPDERRIFFVLPWQGQTLVGTTEVRQILTDRIVCSTAEKDYLLAAYQHYRQTGSPIPTVTADFAGVRPLIYSAADPNRATRESAL